MTRSPLVIHRLTVEERGCTCFRFDLIHGTRVPPSFTTTLLGVSGIFRPFLFAMSRGRGATSTQVFQTVVLMLWTYCFWFWLVYFSESVRKVLTGCLCYQKDVPDECPNSFDAILQVLRLENLTKAASRARTGCGFNQ